MDLAFLILVMLSQASVEGMIRFDGPIPAARMIEITRDQNVCGNQKPDESVLILNSGLANVVVSIEGAPAGIPQARDLVVANELCRFVPRVSAAMVGSSLVVQNRDSILHNTHAYLSDETTFFNVGFAFKGMQVKRPLTKPEVMRFECDAGHTWMKAFIHIFAHPFFAVSDSSGNFRIDGLPPGQYTIKAWHEKLGTQTKRIQIANGINRSEFTFKQ